MSKQSGMNAEGGESNVQTKGKDKLISQLRRG